MTSFQLNITGGAYFGVYDPAIAEIIYTKNRMFYIDSIGRIVTGEGYILNPAITILPPYDEPVAVSETGFVTALVGGAWQPAGQIIAVTFLSPGGLLNLGDGYFSKTTGSGSPTLGVPGSGSFAGVIIYYIDAGTKLRRPVAVLDKPDIMANFIIKAETMVLLIGNNTDGYFNTVTPPLATVTADINNLKAAEALAGTRTNGRVAQRDKQYNITLRDLWQLQIYVQQLADSADNVDLAIAIINAAGLAVKKHGLYTKGDLQAGQGPAPGMVMLKAKAVTKAGAYEWESSADNINWTRLPSTLPANTLVKGLTPGTTVYFHCRAVMQTGVRRWSGVVAVVVI